MPKPERAGDRGEGMQVRTGRDRPIIFSAPMVRALLAGTKTQTRRVLKLPPKQFEHPQMGGWEATVNGGGGCFRVGRDGERIPVPETVGIWHRTTGYCTDAPHQAGDRLWVKEEARRTPDAWTYTADGAPVAWPGRGDLAGRKRDICTSLFLPRSCSRLTLIVKAVKVERLQDISEEDAEAEGCQFDIWDQALAVRDYSTPDGWFCGWGTMEGQPGYVPEERIWRESYRTLWNGIHGPDAWNANPWVAALTFRAIPQNIDSLDPTPVCDTPTDQAAPPTPEHSR